jgi:RNA-directed DNA polymerase
VKAFLDNIRETIKKGWSLSASALIGVLNPKLRGWGNFHRHIVAGKTFGKVDTCVYNYLWQWMRRKHHKKRKSWMVNKYWSKGSQPWTFSAVVKKSDKIQTYELIKLHKIGIKRHVKIRSKANSFDPEFFGYFQRRRNFKRNKRFKLKMAWN